VALARLGVVVLALVATACQSVAGTPVTAPPDASAPTATASSEPTATIPASGVTDGPCRYRATPDEPAAKPVGLPDDPDPTPDTGTIEVTLETDQGEIPLTLDRAKAPCTVQSVLHLARSKFYDGSPCHRLVDAATFKVLQCGSQGDNTNGGPGFTIPDEKPTDLRPAPDVAGASIYPRGVIAMATRGTADSGGSQFFLVLADSYLSPDYAIFGTVGEAGLTVLDKIVAAGHDGSLEPTPGGGRPNLPTTIAAAVVDE
jgi:peptidyl-prolyl cis-trans isomerase B (cyclophilin B)